MCIYKVLLFAAFVLPWYAAMGNYGEIGDTMLENFTFQVSTFSIQQFKSAKHGSLHL